MKNFFSSIYQGGFLGILLVASDRNPSHTGPKWTYWLVHGEGYGGNKELKVELLSGTCTVPDTWLVLRDICWMSYSNQGLCMWSQGFIATWTLFASIDFSPVLDFPTGQGAWPIAGLDTHPQLNNLIRKPFFLPGSVKPMLRNDSVQHFLGPYAHTWTNHFYHGEEDWVTCSFCG